MKEEIKELRVTIDGIAQLVKELKPVNKIDTEDTFFNILDGTSSIEKSYQNSKEIEKAVDSLYLAKAWLGKVLQELGNENPYGSGYKTKEDIVPTQDVNRGFLHEPLEDEKPWKTKNHIEKVDWLRTEIEKIIKEAFNYNGLPYSENFGMNKLAILAVDNFYTHLSEARFWLGFELERIKSEK